MKAIYIYSIVNDLNFFRRHPGLNEKVPDKASVDDNLQNLSISETSGGTTVKGETVLSVSYHRRAVHAGKGAEHELERPHPVGMDDVESRSLNETTKSQIFRILANALHAESTYRNAFPHKGLQSVATCFATP
jgi:hypothetical protein